MRKKHMKCRCVIITTRSLPQSSRRINKNKRELRRFTTFYDGVHGYVYEKGVPRRVVYCGTSPHDRNKAIKRLATATARELKRRKIAVDFPDVIYNSNCESPCSSFSREHSKFVPPADNAKIDWDFVFLGDATRYLIGLYYKTGLKYSFDKSKIFNLLAIADMLYFKNGKKMFEASIQHNLIGVAVENAWDYIFYEYSKGDYKNAAIEGEIVFTDDEIPLLYRLPVNDSLTDWSRKVLFDVFKAFGTYEPKALCCLIDDILPEFSTGRDVDKDKFFNFIHSINNFSIVSKYKNNSVLKFLKKY